MTRRKFNRSRVVDRRGREGVVLLIVLFVLAMSTAVASAALRMGRAALHGAGEYRLAEQSRYLTEGVLHEGIVLTEGAREWAPSPTGAIDMFALYGTRTMDPVHQARLINSGDLMGGAGAAEVPLFEDPSAANGMVGTLGTVNTYSPNHAANNGRDAMAVHVFDCVEHTASAAGAQANAVSGSNREARPKRLFCQVESHARLEADGVGTRRWTVPGQGDYLQVVAGIQRMAVGTVIMEIP